MLVFCIFRVRLKNHYNIFLARLVGHMFVKHNPVGPIFVKHHPVDSFFVEDATKIEK